jgi:undecaprenyl-diphosphatase
MSWTRADKVEAPICRRFNRAISVGALRHLFRFASRMGDGGFWIMLLAILPAVYGAPAWRLDFSLVITSGIGLLIYHALKVQFSRQRPFFHAGIDQGERALDEYSFPSGHTMHAVNFTWSVSTHFPHLAPVLIPLCILISLSRLTLGLHYPTDVLCGALLGAALASFTVPF